VITWQISSNNSYKQHLSMSTPGPTLIKKCNRCDGLMKQRTIASGNTFGARYWTDGKVDASMLPLTPSAVRCPHCHALLWVSSLEEVGEIPGPRGFGVPRPEYDHSFDALPFIEKLEADDYLMALRKGELPKDQEAYLRTMYWRLMNDPRRRSQTPIAFSAEEQENLRSLLPLVSETDEPSRLIRAEIYRELGEFEECANALDYDFCDDYIPAAVTIYMLQEEKNSSVGEIQHQEMDVVTWHYHRDQKKLKPGVPFDPNGPPIFKIKSRDWWIKVLGMLQHNWALIDDGPDSGATVYFFHDGEVGMGCYGYSRAQLKGRYAIVDSLDFESVQLAKEALARNGFRLHGDDERLGSDVKPCGNFYDVRGFEEGVYSSQGHWINK